MNLRVKESELLGFETGKYVQLREIFQKNNKHHVTVLITGEPGYGKTTLCKKISYDWGADDDTVDYLHHFDFVVLIILRELGEKSVSDAVLEKILGPSDSLNSNLKTELYRANFNILIILDGVDEIRDKHSLIEFLQNNSMEISLNMTIIITSRPHAAEEIREHVTDRLALEGFSAEQKLKYIELVIKRSEDIKSHLQMLVQNDSFYSELATCPLMLHMLCCLPRTKYFKTIKTRTELYIRIFKLIIKRYMKKKGEKHNLKKGQHFYGEDLLCRLGSLLIGKDINDQILEKAKKFEIIETLRITNDELTEYFSEEKEYEFIIALDIIVKYSEENDVISFDIVHRTFMHFIIAVFLHSSFSPIPFAWKSDILLFLFGLFLNPFPDNLLDYISHFIYNPMLWLDLYNQINCECNKNLFCLNTKLFCEFEQKQLSFLNYIKKNFQVFNFTQIFFVIPESKQFYENWRKELVEFHKNYNNPNVLDIFLLLDASVQYHNCPINSDKITNICDTADMIINLLSSFNWKKFKIYFYGIIPYRNIEPNLIPEENIHTFKKIENPAAISKEVRKKLAKSKNFVALHSLDKEIGAVQYLIKTEQFKSLEHIIKIFPSQI